jgi:AcrR family transcriptional regulator
MRRANVQLRYDRRDEILAAAQRCFVRSGFHGASMQDICAEAGMSPGNSTAIPPRRRWSPASPSATAPRSRSSSRADLSHGFFAVLEGMAHHHFAEKPNEQLLLCTEVMAEARRNPDIARISVAFDADVKKWLGDLLRAAVAQGDIPADVDLDRAATMLMIIADGVWWRRALDPAFDPAAMVSIFMDITRHMLRARPAAVRENEETSQ